MTDHCPFCHPEPERVFLETDLVIGLWDKYPVSPGHALLVPRRHVADWFEATPAEQLALLSALPMAKEAVEREHHPQGYNIGINLGQAAGQTVFHLHIYLIPRYGGRTQRTPYNLRIWQRVFPTLSFRRPKTDPIPNPSPRVETRF